MEKPLFLEPFLFAEVGHAEALRAVFVQCLLQEVAD